MKFKGSPQFTHSQQDKVGILITNLGTPDAPTPQALKRYLREFLWDPRVVEVPRPLWWLILNLVILNIRPRRSAKAYQTVWTEEGSPLMTNTQAQRDALAERFANDFGGKVIVEFAMRYGNPSISSVLDRMMEQGVRKLVVLPLYPQYSASTSGSTFDALAADFLSRRWMPDFRFIRSYHDNSDYIEAMATRIERHWTEHGRTDKLIFSYHGVPKRYLLSGDPYHCECHKSARLLAERLGLKKDEYETSFQSRFGREEWLKPYTDFRLKALPGEGVKSVQIFCPGFSSDCLETIEEIGVENRDYFLEAGGERYEYISALNAEEGHIDALEQLIRREVGHWFESPQEDTDLIAERARALGADK